MTVLENIYIGRHHLLKNNFIKGSFYWIFRSGQKEEVKNRIEAEKILDFLEISDIRKKPGWNFIIWIKKKGRTSKSNCYKPKLNFTR